MFIVLFHVLYLFGKLIYTRYNCPKPTKAPDIVNKECYLGDMDLLLKKRNSGMEKVAQPPGDNSGDEGDMENKISFFPPAYIQRYVAVQAVLEEPRYRKKLRKVVDFGCAELDFVRYLKRTPGVEEVLCVDIDNETLDRFQKKAAPLHADYLHTRENPLIIRIIEGSVTHNDKLLEKTDAVICIELIEHLYPDTLTDLPYNIFGFIKPQVAIMTTPNFDFNVLFKKPGFRHWDHKFEWTREQFQDWAENIVSRFPEYEVSFTGVCEGPPGSEDLGCCSQMAIFHRHCDLNEYVFPGAEGLFKVVTTYEYPFHVDNRSDEQKILDDALYFIHNYSMYNLEFAEEVPLKKLLDPLKMYHVTIESLKELLEQNGWTVVDRDEGPVVLIPEPSDSENESELSDRGNWNDLDSTSTDHEVIEDEWDADPGPPAHYSPEQILNMAIERENWDEEPSIASDPMQEDSTVQDETSSLITQVAKPMHSEENIARQEYDSEDLECIEIDSEVKQFQGPLTSSYYLDLPLQTECAANEMKGPSPLAFSFDEIRKHKIELPLQKLPEVGFEMHSANNGSKNNFSNGNSSRKTYRKTQKTVTVSQTGVFDELGSLCSMYLETSQDENSKTCFDDLSNRSFESTISAMSSMNDSKMDEDLASNNNLSVYPKKPRVDDSSSSFSSSALNTLPIFTSSPLTSEELKRKCRKDENFKKGKEILNESEIWEGMTTPESISSNNPLQSSSQTSLQSFNIASTSSSSKEKWCLEGVDSMLKSSSVTLKNGSEAANKRRDEINSDSEVTASSKYFNDEEEETVVNSTTVNGKTSLDKSRNSQEAPKIVKKFVITESHKSSLNVDRIHSLEKKESNANSSELGNIGKYKNVEPTETFDTIETKEITPKSETSADEVENLRGEVEFEKMIGKSRGSSVFLDFAQMIEVKATSSEALDTPPNSWSPEVMDSGYPNSGSAHDMTPEYDLPSISHDRISDSESPSIAEAPRPGFLEVVEVENGDLANNNRDYEGNNMIAVQDNEDDDLQPLIDVLEDDMENENDIYVLQNGFPAWLLRILQMQDIEVAGHMQLFYRPLNEAAGGDAANADFDEGFSSSSDEELEEDDESCASGRIRSLNVEGFTKDCEGHDP